MQPLFWLMLLVAIVGLAIFWVTYLIKLALNEERLRERIRQIERKREEARRAEEDKQRRRKEAAIANREGTERIRKESTQKVDQEASGSE